jgi:hypothetical protein
MKQHIVEVRIHKRWDSQEYKVHHEEKFDTKQGADDFVAWFSEVSDKNRRAVYIGVEE